VLEEYWLSEEGIPVDIYVNDFYLLQTAISLARNHLGKVNTKMKEHFDKVNDAEVRLFNDLVLVLLTLHNQPLQSRDARLFNVLERSSDVRCAIEIPKRRKKKRHVHVNLPKKYYERDDLKENTGNVSDVSVIVLSNSNENDENIFVEPNLTNSVISVNPDKLKHFSAAQAVNIHFLLQEYEEPFGDVSRLFPRLDITAETRDVQPVLQFPCPLDVRTGAFLQADVRRRKEQGFICPCLGPLASAAVLVLESSGLHPRGDCRRARAAAWTTRFRSVE